MKKAIGLILSVMMVFGAMGGVVVSAASPAVVSVIKHRRCFEHCR